MSARFSSLARKAIYEWSTGCHVLAHESFEDELTAKMMNDYYVNVKVLLSLRLHRLFFYLAHQVDREERPDVDRLYMTFLQATTGGGGWPMSICKSYSAYMRAKHLLTQHRAYT